MTWRCAEAHFDDSGRVVRCSSTSRPDGSRCLAHQPSPPAASDAPPDAETTSREFVARLRAARRAAGMSQRRLASVMGVYHGSIGNWEMGLSSPNLLTLRPLAHALGVDPKWLLGIEDSPKAGDSK